MTAGELLLIVGAVLCALAFAALAVRRVTAAAVEMCPRPILSNAGPGWLYAVLSRSISASSSRSPSAALTRRVGPAMRQIRFNWETVTRPRGPSAGSFASIQSAPPAIACAASASFATLTSSSMAVLYT